MAAPLPVSIFIPHWIINQLSDCFYALGHLKILNNNVLINCTAIVKRNGKFMTEIFNELSKCNSFAEQREEICLLGLIYSSTKQIHFETDLVTNFSDVKFIIRVNAISGSFHIEHKFVKNYIPLEVQIVIYDSYSIMKSHLLPLTKQIFKSDAPKDSFISFLVQTSQIFMEHSSKCFHHKKYLKETNFIQLNDDLVSQFISFFCSILLWMMSNAHKFISFIFKWWPQQLTSMFLLTSLGQQFHQRYLHVSRLVANYEAGVALSVKFKNLICAILIDLICGCLVTYAFLNTDLPSTLLNIAMSGTNDIVNSLQYLINWLMGAAPAGLKLNIPLNYALGKFFLYHIYLWESYMMVVKPLFAFIFKMSTVIGIFGLTFVLSLLSDLISLATIHIYCFYGYAARLYGYQVLSLSALWRLFRGKKWNPLRQRIDSYTYNVHQLYLGTLIFTVLLFLLPTVMVYYIVFTCLRILVLIIQGLVSRFINILTIFPLYCFIARVLNSPETTGDVYFTVFNAEGVMTLSMQASQVSFVSVIQLTLPDLENYQEILTWKDFLSSIVWGKIVYPL